VQPQVSGRSTNQPRASDHWCRGQTGHEDDDAAVDAHAHSRHVSPWLANDRVFGPKRGIQNAVDREATSARAFRLVEGSFGY